MDVARVLIEKGAEIDYKTINGETALYFAAENGRLNSFLEIKHFLYFDPFRIQARRM